jgi:hypothetical protein
LSCKYSFDDLLSLLRQKNAVAAARLKRQHRQVERGLLSVGLKIHCLDDGRQFDALVAGLGGAQRILEVNSYKDARASLCLVLPPVGGAGAAILLMEALESFVGCKLFGNKEMQIQVCSPGRLSARHAALLAITFYLGSDTLRRYNLNELETSFTRHWTDPRGRRLILYDADGDFDGAFDWWGSGPGGPVVQPQLPIRGGRSDVLAGSASRLDIENINLIATLLMHAERDGHWKALGRKFAREIEALLDRHLLSGLLAAPWVCTTDRTTVDDLAFFAALQELVGYAFEEAVRVRKRGVIFSQWEEIPARPSLGILQEVQELLTRYRAELVRQSALINLEGRT